MVSSISLSYYLVCGIMIIALMWIISLVEPMVDKLFGALGKGGMHIYHWVSGTSPSGLGTDEEDAVVEEAQEYAKDWRLLIVACVAKFAKIDGVVTKNEIAVVEVIFGYLDLTSEERRQAVDTFNYAKQGKATLRACVQLYAGLQQHDRTCVLALMVLFFRVAHADGVPNTVTQRALEETCDRVGIGYQECAEAYEQSRRGTPHAPDDLEAAYTVLGCQPSDALSAIKDRYRQLVKDFHPDTIIGKNLAPDFVKFAEERFKQIQAAYETVTAARGAENT